MMKEELSTEERRAIPHPVFRINRNGNRVIEPLGVIDSLNRYRLIFRENQFYIYNGCHYEEYPEEEILNEIYDIAYRNDAFIKKSEAKDIVRMLQAVAQKPIEDKLGEEYQGELIVVKNGIVNLTTNKLLPFTPYHFSTFQLCCNFYPDGFFDEESENNICKILPSESVRKLFYEMVGYTFFSKSMNPPILLNIYGRGETGKSALHEMIKKFANSVVSNIAFNQITKQFMTHHLNGKLCNISGETGNGNKSEFDRVNGELLKQLSDGQVTFSDVKHKNPINFKNTAKLWFITNTIPDFNDTSSGMTRRLKIIPCRVKQKHTDRMWDRLTTDVMMNHLLHRAIECYRDFVARGREFTDSDEISTEKTHFVIQDSVKEFLFIRFGTLDVQKLREGLHKQSLKNLYDDYIRECIEGGRKKVSRNTLSERIRNEYDMVSEYENIYYGDDRTKSAVFYMPESDDYLLKYGVSDNTPEPKKQYIRLPHEDDTYDPYSEGYNC